MVVPQSMHFMHEPLRTIRSDWQFSQAFTASLMAAALPPQNSQPAAAPMGWEFAEADEVMTSQ